jgi:VWFA-related protein
LHLFAGISVFPAGTPVKAMKPLPGRREFMLIQSMPNMRKFATFGVFAVAAAGWSSAQEIPAPRSSTTPQIQLDVVVTPKSGSPAVANLEQADFTVVDNKVAQPIKAFKAISAKQEPVEVILVVDAVNTSITNIGYERGQISNFLKANGGHLAYPTKLAIVTDTGTKMQNDFATDGNAIDDTFENFVIGLRDIRRSTGIYGADERFQISLKSLATIAASDPSRPGRKIILWISPGWPLLSGPHIELSSEQQSRLFATIVGLSDQLRKERVTLYSIDSLGVSEGLGRVFLYQEYVKGVSKPSQVAIGDLSLQALAEQTGGIALNSSDVAGLLHQCLADLDAYYELTVDALPAEEPNEYHHLEVKVDKPGLVARTRQGYYAQP